MHNGRFRHETHLVSGVSRPQGVVGILGVEEVGLIPFADVIPALTGNQPRTSAGPRDRAWLLIGRLVLDDLTENVEFACTLTSEDCFAEDPCN